MSDISANNKRIAKNTLLLYFKMLFLLLISLYTSRVILKALGVEDFGIYNVVGGVVTMFSIISASLSGAISRFLTFELGKGSIDRLKRVFSASITIQLLLSLIILVLAESVGIWFLNNKMIIPADRLTAANWVFHFSLLTFVINLISIPYNAAIVAHEKMIVFAYISIIEGLGKLGIAYFIVISPIDRLIFYALLIYCLSLFIRLIYGYYCKNHFEECTYHFHWDKEILKKMFSFAGWNFIGSTSSLLRDQGGNIIINLFCGPTVNAARGIAFQLNGAITGFVSNFMMALNPQITKSYAKGDYGYMMSLIFQGARFSFYILLLVSLPVLVNTHYVLRFWLHTVPEHSVLFVRLVLIFALSESISFPLITAMLATGNIRNYQIVVGGLQMLNLPISYALLKLGYIPETVLIVAICISQCCLMARLFMLRGMIRLNVTLYLKQVWLNVIIVSFVSSIVPFWLESITDESFFRFLYLSIICVINVVIVELFVGCDTKERAFVWSKTKQIITKIKYS